VKSRQSTRRSTLRKSQGDAEILSSSSDSPAGVHKLGGGGLLAEYRDNALASQGTKIHGCRLLEIDSVPPGINGRVRKSSSRADQLSND